MSGEELAKWIAVFILILIALFVRAILANRQPKSNKLDSKEDKK